VSAEFRPDLMLSVLKKHDVRFVLIGGLAGAAYGSPRITTDVDITPERGLKNLEKLSAALTDLGARIRTQDEPGGLPFGHDASSLARVEILNLATDAGNLDISFSPSGTDGFTDLRRDAVQMVLFGTPTDVASLADVIRSKEAAGRPKDHAELPTLRGLLEKGERGN
jgi:hypothetical protein